MPRLRDYGPAFYDCINSVLSMTWTLSTNVPMKRACISKPAFLHWQDNYKEASLTSDEERGHPAWSLSSPALLPGWIATDDLGDHGAGADPAGNRSEKAQDAVAFKQASAPRPG